MKAIVLGLGIMGASAAHSLAGRGWQVQAFDANARGHTFGASHGQSRIIRQAYYEDPNYVPLLRRAYEMWFELQAQVSEPLLDLQGGLFLGNKTSELVYGSRRSAELHGIDHEFLNAAELKRRWPQFTVPDDFCAVFEPGAGTMFADRCLEAQLDMASRLGAELNFDQPILSWTETSNGVSVTTASGTYDADRLVIAAGPWAADVLRQENIPVTVRRVVACHFEPQDPECFKPESLPIYCLESGSEFFYGFPNMRAQGMKIGRHDFGETVTADSVDREIHDSEIEERRRFLDAFLPGAAGSYLFGVTCLYAMSPDCHFILDVHPKHKNVSFACGFSGHGFKFGAVIGEILADFATAGSTAHPIQFLSVSRFASAI